MVEAGVMVHWPFPVLVRLTLGVEEGAGGVEEGARWRWVVVPAFELGVGREADETRRILAGTWPS